MNPFDTKQLRIINKGWETSLEKETSEFKSNVLFLKDYFGSRPAGSGGDSFKVWFGLILWHINHWRSFNTKSFLYIYSCPTTELRKILAENTTILEHHNNKQKLQIRRWPRRGLGLSALNLPLTSIPHPARMPDGPAKGREVYLGISQYDDARDSLWIIKVEVTPHLWSCCSLSW